MVKGVSVCVLPCRRTRLSTSPVEWMSVSMPRLEAGRPSCDSMWFAGASRSWLLTAKEAGGKGDQGHGSQRLHGGLHFRERKKFQKGVEAVKDI